ncbi:L,D-transpeptidase family protein [Streptomyces sp. NPDC051976]|uniref:L,D-transpeptidase family protein n=1 Tax=Streptomyces sp. NPDC051976 TaxID=3154947 RepID=UPI003442F02D
MTAASTDPLNPSRTEPQGRGRHRQRRKRRGVRGGAIGAAVGVVLAVVGAGYVVVSKHGGTAVADTFRRDAVPPTASAPAAPVKSAGPGTSAQEAALTRISGLGPKTLASIPAGSRQVLVASGRAKNSSDTVVTLWSRTADGHWTPGAAWPAHNALHGWTREHHVGDLRSPIGVFTLSDAGGFDANPGAKLPYHHSSAFRAGGVGFDGEPLDAAFDYVIAIDYNRVPGTSPLDGSQPLGHSRGGGIWVHVDHGGPTHGCVSVSATHMVDLLHTLVPADHPVIVMGDKASLAV